MPVALDTDLWFSRDYSWYHEVLDLFYFIGYYGFKVREIASDKLWEKKIPFYAHFLRTGDIITVSIWRRLQQSAKWWDTRNVCLLNSFCWGQCRFIWWSQHCSLPLTITAIFTTSNPFVSRCIMGFGSRGRNITRQRRLSNWIMVLEMIDRTYGDNTRQKMRWVRAKRKRLWNRKYCRGELNLALFMMINLQCALYTVGINIDRAILVGDRKLPSSIGRLCGVFMIGDMCLRL